MNDKIKKNILIIDIDALMPERTGFGGNVKSVSPFLNEIAQESLYCSNTFSMGNPTEFALPGLFASSYLLDEGGYRYGISQNEITFAEVLKENGYSTSVFMTAFRPKLDSYDRGIDDFFNLIDIQVTEKNLMNTANWYREQYINRKSIVTKDECIEELSQYYNEYLDDLLLYCDNWNKYQDSNIIPSSSIFDNVDYELVKSQILMDKELLKTNQHLYIKDFLDGGHLGLSKIARKVINDRKKITKSTFMDIRVQLFLIINIIFGWMSSSSYRSAKNILGSMLERIRNGRKSYLTRYPSGEYLLQGFKNWINNKTDNTPFFTYIKLMDVHELNFYTHDICDEDKQKINDDEFTMLKDVISSMRDEKKYVGNLLYDCAIRYEDNIIKKLFGFLKENNILDNTIVVVTADHGGQFPNLPIRDGQSHRVDSFVDELYKIPLIFYNKDIQTKEYEGLVSSVDINSTLLDLVGINIPDSFRGRSLLTQHDQREYVLMENQGRGPCHLKYKPIRVCVRTKTLKLVYEAPPLSSGNGFIKEIFDLQNDPDEYNNLVDDKLYIDSASELVRIARNRVMDIIL